MQIGLKPIEIQQLLISTHAKKVVEFDDPYSVSRDYGGTEYEAIGALGSACGVEDLKASLLDYLKGRL